MVTRNGRAAMRTPMPTQATTPPTIPAAHTALHEGVEAEAIFKALLMTTTEQRSKAGPMAPGSQPYAPRARAAAMG
jgi:hypothetical protein